MFDLIIENGSIIDGTGKAAFIGNIAIKDGKISKLNVPGDTPSKDKIDATGKFVTPGFIDIHRHSDLKVLDKNFGEVELRQGITTVIVGNCGLSAAPCPPNKRNSLYSFLEPILGRSKQEYEFDTFKKYRDTVEKYGVPCNFGALVGNNTVRIAVKGFKKETLTESEMKKVKYYIEEALDSGAFGLSLGLAYSPEDNYTFEELNEIIALLYKYDALLVTHIRSEGKNLVSAINEVTKLAEAADVPLHISHLKAAGRNVWGKGLKDIINIIEHKRQQGMDITCDVYPYEAGSTTLLNILPPKYREGGIDEIIERFKCKEVIKELEKDMSTDQGPWDNLVVFTGWENVVIGSVNTDANSRYVGMSVKDISKLKGKSCVECVADLIVEEKGRVGKFIFHMSMDDVKRVIKWENSMIASDSLYNEGGLPHPRVYGTFPRILARFVRDEKLLTIQEAIYKMTGLPAERFKLDTRGIIKEGNAADIVIFDLNKITDKADYTNPKQFSGGFSHVIVNGHQVIKAGQLTNIKPGSFLER